MVRGRGSGARDSKPLRGAGKRSSRSENLCVCVGAGERAAARFGFPCLQRNSPENTERPSSQWRPDRQTSGGHLHLNTKSGDRRTPPTLYLETGSVIMSDLYLPRCQDFQNRTNWSGFQMCIGRQFLLILFTNLQWSQSGFSLGLQVHNVLAPI